MNVQHARVLLLGLAVACGPKAPPPPAAEPQATDGSTSVENGAVAEPEWSNERRDEQVNAALSLLITGRPDDARRALDMLAPVAQKEPDLAEVPYNEGVAWLIVGDLEQARKRFLRATDIDPSLAEAWLNLGAMSEEVGEHDRALQSYRSGLRHSPDHPALMAAVVGVLRQVKQYDAAVREAKAAIAADSNNVGAYNELGQVYLAMNKLELAQFVYDRAIQQVPGASEDPRIHANLARVYLAQERDVQARGELERALELDPDLVLARLYVADLAIEDRDYERVVSTLEPTLAVTGDDPAVHMNLGIGYRGTGRLEEAQKAYDKALELDPSNPDPYLNIAVIVGDHLKDYDRALGILDTYERQGGTRTDLSAEFRADFEKQQKRIEAAKRRAEARKKREERKKLAAAAEKRRQEEEAKAATEESAAPPPPAAPDPAPEPNPAPEPAPETAAPAETAPEPPPPPPPAPTASAAALGSSCTDVGACGAGLECAHDAICREVGKAGTFTAGLGCMQDADCAYGLSCSGNVCSEAAAAPAAASPWGN